MTEANTPMTHADWLRACLAWLDDPEMREAVKEHISDAADELDRRIPSPPPAVLGDAFKVDVWTEEERDGMVAAFKRAEERHGFYESLFAAAAFILRHREARARAAIAALSPWLPIEQAPRDGTPVLGAWRQDKIMAAVCFTAGYWRDEDGNAVVPPDLYMPLPTPPGETT